MVMEKILVSLKQTSAADYALDNLVLNRALSLAAEFDAALHLFQAVNSHPFMHNAFYASPESARWQEALVQEERVRLERLVEAVVAKGVSRVDCSIAESVNRADAIISTAEKIGADLILKESRDASFILGLLNNTDWELIRDASAPVWMAHGAKGPQAGVVAALEVNTSSSGQWSLDHQVFERALAISTAYDAPLHVVHAFQTPRTALFSDYVPLFPGEQLSPETLAVLEADHVADRERIAGAHGQSIQNFLSQYAIDIGDIVIEEGPTAQIIKQQAEQHQAGLIVMGASPGKGRWDRILGHVTAEPALEHAPCDILFVH